MIKLPEDIQKLNVSRQWKYQLWRKRQGLCILCGKNPLISKAYCLECGIKLRDDRHTRRKCKDTALNCKSRIAERGFRIEKPKKVKIIKEPDICTYTVACTNKKAGKKYCLEHMIMLRDKQNKKKYKSTYNKCLTRKLQNEQRIFDASPKL